MILGLDVSTSKIGYCILNEKKELIENEFINLNHCL
jgi:RNase H-fold protein (predicted Holliday junction resolvase)